MSNINDSINELHRAFHIFNKVYYNNKLPEPAILIMAQGNRKNMFGWCTVKEVWRNENLSDKRYEINLIAEYLFLPLEDIMATLLHEMVHLHCLVNGIKDTSRGGTYHNKRFKVTAEIHGLNIERDDEIGWSLTQVNNLTKSIIKEYGIKAEAFSLYRAPSETIQEVKEEIYQPKLIKTRKKQKIYICPGCGTKIKSSKEIQIKCIHCNQEFEEVLKSED